MGYITSISRTLIRTISRNSFHESVFVQGAAESFSLQGGRTLEWIVVTFPADTTLSGGTTLGGTELFADEFIPAATPTVIQIGYYQETSGTIYLTGTVANGQIEVYRF